MIFEFTFDDIFSHLSGTISAGLGFAVGIAMAILLSKSLMLMF